MSVFACVGKGEDPFVLFDFNFKIFYIFSREKGVELFLVYIRNTRKGGAVLYMLKICEIPVPPYLIYNS